MTFPTPSKAERVCVGQFAGAHGVRGQVRVRSFTADPASITAYGPVEDEGGTKHFVLKPVGQAKDALVMTVDGVTDRDQAQALAGTRLYIARDKLPELADEDEYYQADLIGCQAVTATGEMLGEVRAVHDFGAGEMLELFKPGAKSLMVPFTRAAVPVVDIAARRLTVDLPVEIAGDRDAETEGAA
jgi:16S rRNA processing protein RimM